MPTNPDLDSRRDVEPISPPRSLAAAITPVPAPVTTAQTAQRTPLFDLHRKLGAKLVDFSGWEMPLFYSGILPEHRAVRGGAGVFDVSHMGRFQVRGAGAEGYLDRMVTNHIAGLADGQAVYTAMCYENGGTVDDLIVYRESPTEYLAVVNAGNRARDFAWLDEHRPANVELTDRSAATALIAVQGPRAAELLAAGADPQVGDLGYYHFRRARLFGAPALVARLGYTGEDGFEVMVDAVQAVATWEALFAHGSGLGLVPAGLGARDTLRFEAGFCLYGHELTEDIGPLEAGIGFAVKLDKDFLGAGALRQQKAAGVPRRLAGVKMDGARIPRQGSAVLRSGRTLGQVTSGMFAPTLDGAYALALVTSGSAEVGSEVEVQIREQAFPARVVPRPFYRRPRA